MRTAAFLLLCLWSLAFQPAPPGFEFSSMPAPTSAPLMDIKFRNTKLGFIACGQGEILKTTDGGVSWKKLSTGTKSFFNTIALAGDHRIYACGFSGALVVSDDEGETWTTLKPPTEGEGNHLWGLFFINEKEGYASVGSDPEHIYYTNDGGGHWTKQSIRGLAGKPISGLQFLDAQTGFLTSGEPGALLKTTDGGKTWKAQLQDLPSGLTGLYFPSKTTGYCTAHDGSIRKTVDGGQSWTLQTSGVSAPLRVVHFANELVGMAVGDNGTVISTIDGGLHWKKEELGIDGFVEGVWFTGSNSGFLCAGNQIIKVALK